MPSLRPLEFVDCVIDGPYFRENLSEHEKEIDHVSKGLKSIIGFITKYIESIKQLKQSQCDLATSLKECTLAQTTKFTLQDAAATDDEIRIQNSLLVFHDILIQNAEAIERMANCFVDGILEPLKLFREQRIGEAKENRKKFERLTGKYCQSLEKYLSTKSKVNETMLSEADHNMDKEKQSFNESSMLHVMMIQEVEEENRLQLVEALIILNKLLSAYYYEAQEALTNEMDTIESVKCAVQMAQDRFDHVRISSKELMNKTLKKSPEAIVSHTNGFFARQGYLFMASKKAVTTVWTKHYCQYNKEGKQLLMYPYVQTNSSAKTHHSEQLRYKLVACVRRASDTIDRRFCFDITVEDRSSTITLQAMSEEDMRLWLDVMDGKEPTYAAPSISKGHGKSEVEETYLNEEGYLFLDTCIREIERRGLSEEGLYRLSGSTAKLSKFIQYAQDDKAFLSLRLDNTDDYDTKLLTSAVKKYLRLLTEPLMTYDLHDKFIAAAKKEQKDLESRIAAVGKLISTLPSDNLRVLTLLIHHFRKIADNSGTNKMTPANLGIVIGPSIFRSKEESVAAIMDFKFAGVVVQIMVENCNRFFPDPPPSPGCGPHMTTSMRGFRSQSMDSGEPGSSATMSASGHMAVPSATGGGSFGGGFSNLTRQLSSKLRRSVRNSPSSSNTTNSGDGGSSVGSGNGGAGGAGNANSNATGSATATSSSSVGGGGGGNSALQLPRSQSHGSHSPVLERAHLGAGLRKSGRALAARLSHPMSRSDKPTPPVPSASVNGNGSITEAPRPVPRTKHRCVRTKYRCIGEHDSELSFEPNRIISNVRKSNEEGWLMGTLDGREGLIPENYVEFLN